MNGDITANGALTLMAEVNTGEITMADGTVVNAGAGTISLAADGDITLGRLVTTNNTALAVAISSTSGGLVDAGDTTGLENIEAIGASAVVTIDAKTGVGSAAAIETKITTLDLDITSGSATEHVQIAETDGLTINKVAQAGSGNVSIVAGNTTAGTLTIAAGQAGVTTNSGNISLTSSGATGDMAVNKTVSSTTGAITLQATAGITVNQLVRTAGGAISIDADTNDDDSGIFTLNTANGQLDTTNNGGTATGAT